MTRTYSRSIPTVDLMGIAAIDLSAQVNSVIAVPVQTLKALVETLVNWQERATMRTRIAQLDYFMLEDMGMTRLDAYRESRKPFWVA